MNFADRLLGGRDGARPALITLDAEHSYGQLSGTVLGIAGVDTAGLPLSGVDER